MSDLLTPAWRRPLRHHPKHAAIMRSRARFILEAAGRRSGKTMLAKRKGVTQGLACTRPNGWYVFAAPTRPQAEQLYWTGEDNLLELIPSWAIRRVWKSRLSIELVTGTEVQVMGLDRPERIEGRPLDWIGVDEFANVKARAWEDHILPALGTTGRPGSAMLYGVPEGRNHFYALFHKAAQGELGPDWEAYHWTSEEVLTPAEIETYRQSMDPRTYAREWLATWEDFEGRAYYSFSRSRHAGDRVLYDPDLPLIVCLDFNRSPGVAAVVQEQAYKGTRKDVRPAVTAVVDEVWIRTDSNTQRVCRELVKRYGAHAGPVYLYGDATGGARGSAKVQGSDWDLVRQELEPVFGARLRFKVPLHNPDTRVRVNATNYRILDAADRVGLLVDPVNAPHVIADYEGVTLKSDGSGDVDKEACERAGLTHLSEAVGYYLVKEHPIRPLSSGTF